MQFQVFNQRSSNKAVRDIFNQLFIKHDIVFQFILSPDEYSSPI